MVWRRVVQLLRKWTPLCSLRAKLDLEEWILALDKKAQENSHAKMVLKRRKMLVTNGPRTPKARCT
jgi:hypothetical protein